MWMSSALIYVAAKFKNDYKFNENNFLNHLKKIWNSMRTQFFLCTFTLQLRGERIKGKLREKYWISNVFSWQDLEIRSVKFSS